MHFSFYALRNAVIAGQLCCHGYASWHLCTFHCLRGNIKKKSSIVVFPYKLKFLKLWKPTCSWYWKCCRGGDWRNGSCHLETLPELGSSLVPSNNWLQYKIITDTLAVHSNTSEAIKVNILNITHMTSRRKDGHSSLYYVGPHTGPASIHRQDCSHWCLPGVPDSWNELLFALYLKHESSQSSKSPVRMAQKWRKKAWVVSSQVNQAHISMWKWGTNDGLRWLLRESLRIEKTTEVMIRFMRKV